MAALTPIGSQTDLENLAVSNDPAFRALIERSRDRAFLALELVHGANAGPGRT